MGICWGDPHFPTPTHTGCLKSKLQLTISSSSSSGTSKGQPTEPRSNESFPDGLIFVESSAKNFTFAELKAATRNFGRDSLLGEGGFGEVFKGLLDDKKTPSGSTKTIIAVKRHNQGSFQGRQEWLAEVNLLGRLYHPNIAKLLGYCYEDHQLLLVYEFASKGSLNNHLFGRGSMDHPLPWEIRLKIAIGAARGLAFLHTVPERPVIYRDVKTSNILLDGSYTSKLSDFGLARLGPPKGESHVTTRVMGTIGYAAPEYVATGHLSVKSDVYGFGVVLLEMLTGLRAMDRDRPKEKQNLVDWAKPRLLSNRKLIAVTDSKAQYPLKVSSQIAKLILKCIQYDPKLRPSMTEVVEVLENIAATNEISMHTDT